MSDINKRINELVSHCAGGNNSLFASMLDTSEANVRNYRNKVQPKFDFLAKIAERLEISCEWLLTGEGAMMLQERETAREQEQTAEMIQIIHTPKVADPIRDDQVVPLYDLEATAGLRAMLDNKSENIIDTIKIPGLPRCDGAVHVVGDSMYPILKSGDIVLYKEVQDVASIFWGEMYLLSMQVDDEEYITVKYIQKSEESKDYIKLVSHNQHHNPKDVPISSIRALALVKASIRLNTIA